MPVNPFDLLAYARHGEQAQAWEPDLQVTWLDDETARRVRTRSDGHEPRQSLYRSERGRHRIRLCRRPDPVLSATCPTVRRSLGGTSDTGRPAPVGIAALPSAATSAVRSVHRHADSLINSIPTSTSDATCRFSGIGLHSSASASGSTTPPAREESATRPAARRSPADAAAAGSRSPPGPPVADQQASSRPTRRLAPEQPPRTSGTPRGADASRTPPPPRPAEPPPHPSSESPITPPDPPHKPAAQAATHAPRPGAPARAPPPPAAAPTTATAAHSAAHRR